MKSTSYPKLLKKTFHCPLLMLIWLVNKYGVKPWGTLTEEGHLHVKSQYTDSFHIHSASTHGIKDWAAGE